MEILRREEKACSADGCGLQGGVNKDQVCQVAAGSFVLEGNASGWQGIRGALTTRLAACGRERHAGRKSASATIEISPCYVFLQPVNHTEKR